jgi:hypothetical protein
MPLSSLHASPLCLQGKLWVAGNASSPQPASPLRCGKDRRLQVCAGGAARRCAPQRCRGGHLATRPPTSANNAPGPPANAPRRGEPPVAASAAARPVPARKAAAPRGCGIRHPSATRGRRTLRRVCVELRLPSLPARHQPPGQQPAGSPASCTASSAARSPATGSSPGYPAAAPGSIAGS